MTSDVVFARTRYEYMSYCDFWRLVDLCGYASCYVDEIDPHDVSKTYIVTPLNGEWNAGWQDPAARIILWDLEWRDARPEIAGVAEVWASDRWYAQRNGARFVPLGSHASLVPARAWAMPAQYDVAMLAYMTPRRQEVAHALRQRGWRLAPNAWQTDRDAVLRYSASMVHVHQHENLRTIAPQRFAVAAANATCFFSETCEDPYPYRPGVDFLQAERRDLASAVTAILSNGKGRDMAAALWYRMCGEFRFDKCVEAAL